MTSDQGLVNISLKVDQRQIYMYVFIYLKNGKEQLEEQIKNLKQVFNQVYHLKKSEIFKN